MAAWDGNRMVPNTLDRDEFDDAGGKETMTRRIVGLGRHVIVKNDLSAGKDVVADEVMVFCGAETHDSNHVPAGFDLRDGQTPERSVLLEGLTIFVFGR